MEPNLHDIIPFMLGFFYGLLIRSIVLLNMILFTVHGGAIWWNENKIVIG
jgi:hypothetical protein